MGRKYSYSLYKPGKRGGTDRRAENEQIEVLWFNYKLRKLDSDTKLIEGMWPYIEPIYNTIIYGTWYSANITIWLQFLNHYMRYKIGKVIGLKVGDIDYANDYNAEYELRVKSTIEYIQRLFKGVSREELEHIMKVAIFDMAGSYQHYGTPNFFLYFSMYYTHRLQNYIKPLIGDFMYYKTVMGYRGTLKHNILLKDEDYSLPESYDNWYETLYVGNTYNDELDFNWVLGYTADLFENLSRYDRHMLKMRYVDDISVMDIGERLGLSRMSTWRHLDKIRDKLGEELLTKHLIGGDLDGSDSSCRTSSSVPIKCKDNAMQGLW